MAILKKLTAVCSAFFMISAIALLPCEARIAYEDNFYNCGVYDVQGVLTEEKVEELDELIRNTAEQIDMYIAVIIVGTETFSSSESDYNVEVYADDCYDSLFNPETGVDTDGLLWVMNNASGYDYITTSGLGQMYFTNQDSNNRCYDILDEITPYLKLGETEEAIEKFCDLCVETYNMGIPSHYYVYDEDGDNYMIEQDGEVVWKDQVPFSYRYDFVGAFVLALPLCLIIGIITYFVIKSQYKFKTSLASSNYICEKRTEMLEKTDLFLRTHTSKTKISTDSGSGGGGGGSSHHSSGGHSHGGGGHHR